MKKNLYHHQVQAWNELSVQEVQRMISLPYERDSSCRIYLCKCVVTLLRSQALYEVWYNFFRSSLQCSSFVLNQQPAVRTATDSWPVITPDPHPAAWLLRLSWYTCYKVESGKKSFAEVPRDLYLCTTHQSKHAVGLFFLPSISPLNHALHFRL